MVTGGSLKYHLVSLGRNDDLFRMTYLAADKSVKALLMAIQVLCNEHRQSKNGTPEERDCSQEQGGTLSDSDM